MSESQKEIFARIYRTGTDVWSHIPFQKMRNEFLSRLSADSLILDLGAGRGHFTTFLVHSGMRAIGLEYVKEQVEKNNKEVFNQGLEKKLRFVEGDALDISFTDESFDAVTDIGLLQHLSPLDIETYRTEVLRVLKPGGLFLLTVLSKDTPTFFTWHPKSAEENVFVKDDMLYHFFTPQEVAKIFSDDFEIISQENEFITEHDNLDYLHTLMKRKFTPTPQQS